MSKIAEQIKNIYAAEQHNHPVTRRDQVPTSYNSLTLEWLNAVLCSDVPGAEVLSFRLHDRDDGSANRQRIAVSYNAAGTKAGLPGGLFCKATEGLQNRLVLGVSGAGETEVNFYNLARRRLAIEAPRAIWAGYDATNYASFVMLENLEGKATFLDERTLIDPMLARNQMSLLANLHSNFYQSPELGTASLPFRDWPDWWAQMMLAAPQWKECTDAALDDCEDLAPPRLYQRRREVWAKTLQSIELHRNLPRTLIHCDVHLKNWYVTPDHRMGLSDWQNVTVGHWSRDLAYAMTTALTVENRRNWEKDLVRGYLEELAGKTGFSVAEDQAWIYIRQQLFSALTFWLITLRPTSEMPDMQPERTTRAFLKRLLTAIDDHDALGRF